MPSTMEKRLKEWEVSVFAWAKVETGREPTDRERALFADAFRKGWISADRHYNPPYGKRE